MSSLFGGRPKKPKLQVITPIEKVQQGNITDENVRRDFAKRRKATVLNQLTEANIKKNKLGAG